MSTGQENRLDRLTNKERQVVMEFVEKVRQRFDGQLVAAVLFGSRARGEAELDSDMDVLVVMSNADPEIRKEIRHLAVEVWLEHDIYLSTRVWSRAHWCKLEELQTMLYCNIRRDGINLLGLSPAAG
ncbi:MAG: nucleotidyltransferase domain-containing protein [Chloroflexota bacterium]|nr:nucleotidyltransferase domain-containing protein [Chloroflexota bacterium]